MLAQAGIGEIPGSTAEREQAILHDKMAALGVNRGERFDLAP
jgi:hypothetical protein